MEEIDAEIASLADANATQPEGEEAKSRLRNEKLILAKLQELSKIEPSAQEPKSTFLAEKPVEQMEYLEFLGFLAKTGLAIEQHSKNLKKIQSNLAYMKGKIEKITEDEKKSLRLYQLQFALYKMQQGHTEKSANLLRDILSKNEKLFFNALGNVAFDREIASRQIEQKLLELQRVENEIVSLGIEKEQAALISSEVPSHLEAKIARVKNSRDAILGEIIDEKFSIALSYLQKGENNRVFEQLAKIDEDIGRLEDKRLFEAKREIVKTFAKEVMGTTAVAVSTTKESIVELADKIEDLFKSTLFVFNERAFTPLDLIKVIVIFIVGLLVGKFYRARVLGLHRKWPSLSLMSIKLMANIGYYVIFFVTFLVALKSMGLRLGNLTLIAGALSIGIGFGLQTVVSNFVAGIILMFEQSIRVGDFIELSETLRGRVTDIRIRSTTIKTNDDIDIIIPNSKFIQSDVINWTLEEDVVRLHIPFGVAYGTRPEDVEKAVLEALEESDLPYLRNDPSRKNAVWMTETGSSSVNYELVVWIYGPSIYRPRWTKSDFLKLIYEALYKNNIEIPFPQLDLHIKETKETLLFRQA